MPANTEDADLLLMQILLCLANEGKITSEEFDKVTDDLVVPLVI